MKYTALISTLWLCWFCACQPKEPTLFEWVDPSHSGINFTNTIVESDTLNLLDNTNMYNGAGVGIGDVNGDGLPDIILAGNMASSRLYLNQGDLRFQDITEEAGLINQNWVTGISLVDINADGLLDIYFSCSIVDSYVGRRNLLYLNRGEKEGIPIFEEVAQKAGIADTAFTTHTVFFDYDLDGDLDAYCLTNATEDFPHDILRVKKTDGSGKSNDKLYRNDGVDSLGIPHFVNVSKEAGIQIEGYGLGIGIHDFNGDGWPDIYAANDFITNDLLWINQQDGTFENQIERYIKHQSHNSMGIDIADIDNNGHRDILILDMLPRDNASLKLMQTAGSIDYYNMSITQFEYQPQFVRNTLQLNQGGGHYSEVGQYSGLHDTHWSWAPLITDLDNDGMRDIVISNGYPKNVIDLDYVNQLNAATKFGSNESQRQEEMIALNDLQEISLPNFLFQNLGDAKFEDVSAQWGFTHTSVSNGAGYGDFDLDGDLDLVIHNINQPVFLYENKLEKQSPSNYFRVSFKGPEKNIGGLGTKLELWAGNSHQVYEHWPFRGFQSTVEPVAHFGLGEQEQIDSLLVIWPDGNSQRIFDIPAKQIITLDYTDASKGPILASTPTLLFQPYPDTKAPIYKHTESEYYKDFRITPLLPHQHGIEGPGIAVGDVNGDGREDCYIAGAAADDGALFIQQVDGSFAQAPFPSYTPIEETGVLFFDADTDGDQDLYIVSGGTNYTNGDTLYQDRLYLNDGNGNFTFNPKALPEIRTSGSCVIAGDYDQDGDLDLFIGGRVIPGDYPMSPKSYLLIN